ncbi:MAG: sugar ABC transporter permease, partial [Clostridia bacterium]|nr:sugar ABC transporter permease [Clostridia bacterium]
MKGNRNKPTDKHKSISYAKWGYIFILPFFVVYLLCKFVPQVLTIYNSFFVNYRDGLMQVGPKFAGFNNFVSLFTPDKTGTIAILKYFLNTIVLWLMGAIPQIVIALFLAVTLSSNRLNLKGQKFFKTVIYMPNLIMASAFAMLVFALFSNVGPINQLLKIIGGENAGFDFM